MMKEMYVIPEQFFIIFSFPRKINFMSPTLGPFSVSEGI